MAYLDPTGAVGDVVNLVRTNQKHLAGIGSTTTASKGVEQAFGDLLASALNNVSQSEITSQAPAQQMIVDPDSVEVHDVTIALAEANLAISMTKAIVDRALAAYREIINVR